MHMQAIRRTLLLNRASLIRAPIAVRGYATGYGDPTPNTPNETAQKGSQAEHPGPRPEEADEQGGSTFGEEESSRGKAQAGGTDKKSGSKEKKSSTEEKPTEKKSTEKKPKKSSKKKTESTNTETTGAEKDKHGKPKTEKQPGQPAHAANPKSGTGSPNQGSVATGSITDSSIGESLQHKDDNQSLGKGKDTTDQFDKKVEVASHEPGAPQGSEMVQDALKVGTSSGDGLSDTEQKVNKDFWAGSGGRDKEP
ncbi:hypothetical protein SAICODRAFT_10430 [Saitoella complicata NRRL Y-17804]|nr:uncharacterized protein SAICODRAFT_10430 [Saitoella complicata NRRL Y-17804]ODQ49906.1 hypothetical protein SAICODRAFT_10430 [Saitoella complicata NRRL Y-17804]